MKKLACIIIPYFGKLPWWIDFFLLSCSKNTSINWLIYSDDILISKVIPQNVTFVKITFDEYKKRISQELEITFNPDNPYKICDIKPFLGFIHRQELKDYRFWGFGDIDVIYGNIENLLFKYINYNIITMHENHVSGHLTFINNRNQTTLSFFKIPQWKELLLELNNVGFDEGNLTYICKKSFFKFKRAVRFTEALQPMWLRLGIRKVYMKEQFTTPLCGRPWRDGTIWNDQPDVWEWHDGIITSFRDKQESPYLHLMNFKECQWNYEKSPWNNSVKMSRFQPSINTSFFYISRKGITATLAPA